METLTAIDHSIFIWINSTLSNAVFDWLLPNITDLHRSPWFYLFLFPILIACILKNRNATMKAVIGVGLAIALADSIAYRLIKPAAARARPEFTTGVSVVLRSESHSGFSMPSNHAANIFAAATVLSFLAPSLTPLFFMIAILVALSRVYVGVHYPSDVLTGALLGVICGYISQKLVKKIDSAIHDRKVKNLEMS